VNYAEGTAEGPGYLQEHHAITHPTRGTGKVHLRMPTPGERLTPRLGFTAALGLNLSVMIGSGIFLLTGQLAALGALGAALAVLLATGAALLTGLSFCRLAAVIPCEGGCYEYTYQLLSPSAGLLSGATWILSNLIGGAAVAIGAAGIGTQILPWLPPQMTAVGICLFFTAINLAGIRQAARVTNLLVGLLMAVLLLFTGSGFVQGGPLPSLPVPSAASVITAASLLFFAFGGMVRVTACAEEVKDPARTIPRAILISILISSGVYLLVTWALLALLRGAPQNPALPLQDLVGGGGYLPPLLLFGMVAAMAVVILTSILSVSRISFAMARRAAIPHIFSRIKTTTGAPEIAILAAGLAMAAFTMIADLSSALVIGALARLLYCTTANIAATRLSAGTLPRLVPVAGALVCGTLIITLAAGALFTTLITLALLSAVLLLSRIDQAGGHRSEVMAGRSK
jgi:basic amino acid/polyamine antiporter, APA family